MLAFFSDCSQGKRLRPLGIIDKFTPRYVELCRLGLIVEIAGNGELSMKIRKVSTGVTFPSDQYFSGKCHY